jgi:hypothetical protein
MAARPTIDVGTMCAGAIHWAMAARYGAGMVGGLGETA